MQKSLSGCSSSCESTQCIRQQLEQAPLLGKQTLRLWFPTALSSPYLVEESRTQRQKEKVSTAGGCCAHPVCAGNCLALVWHTLQLPQPCGGSEAVHSHQGVPCTSGPITWLSTCSDKLQEREIVSLMRSEQQFLKLFPQFSSLLPTAPLRRVTRGLHQDCLPHDGPNRLSNPAQKDPWPQRAKSPLKGTSSHACAHTNPACSGLRLPMPISSKAPSSAWSLAG